VDPELEHRVIFRSVFVFAAALCWLLAFARLSIAGTIRDDRDPSLYTTLAQNPTYAPVGELDVDVFEAGQPAVGTGTLVARDWVLTAAHVVESGRAIRFNVGGQTYSAARWVVNQKYTGDLLRGYDIALVQLGTPVTNVTPAGLYRSHREFNQVGTFVGVGRTGTGITGDTTDDRIKRAGTNVIDGYLKRDKHGLLVTSQKLKSAYRTFAVDFDQPGNPSINHFGSPDPTDLEYLISLGDSGGPTFIDDPRDNQGPVVAGIHSYGEIFDAADDSSYGDVVGETRVSKFAKWVDKVITNEKYRDKLDFGVPTLGNAALDFQPLGRSLPAVEAVPEPASGVLMLGGAMLLLSRRRRAAVARVPNPCERLSI
jgi:hypothetical protein